MNEQRLKEEGATAYSGGVACADSLGGKRGGVEWRWCSCQFVASCICIVGFPPNKRWMDGQLDSLGLLLPTKRMCFWRWWGWCNAAAVSIAFGPWDSTGLSAIQLKPVNQ